MNEYHIVYGEYVEADLEEAYTYIADELLDPDAARDYVRRIIETIESLSYMPYRYRRYEAEPWYGRGWRVVPVNRHVIVYYPDDTHGIVWILRVVPCAMDRHALLRRTPNPDPN